MFLLISFLISITLYIAGAALCFTGNSNFITYFFGFGVLLLTSLINLGMILEYIKRKTNPEIYRKKINLQRKLYKELGNVDIETAKKIIDSKENILDKKSGNSKLRNFYFKYIRKEINEKEIAEHVLSKIIHDKEIKEKKILRKENKRIKELESKKEIKIISI